MYIADERIDAHKGVIPSTGQGSNKRKKKKKNDTRIDWSQRSRVCGAQTMVGLLLWTMGRTSCYDTRVGILDL